MKEKELPTLACAFRYGGFERLVENVTVDWDKEILTGMERRKGGKFSNRIKTYRFDRVDGVVVFKEGSKNDSKGRGDC